MQLANFVNRCQKSELWPGQYQVETSATVPSSQLTLNSDTETCEEEERRVNNLNREQRQ